MKLITIPVHEADNVEVFEPGTIIGNAQIGITEKSLFIAVLGQQFEIKIADILQAIDP
jgi:hypothetical protein